MSNYIPRNKLLVLPLSGTLAVCLKPKRLIFFVVVAGVKVSQRDPPSQRPRRIPHHVGWQQGRSGATTSGNFLPGRFEVQPDLMLTW